MDASVEVVLRESLRTTSSLDCDRVTLTNDGRRILKTEDERSVSWKEAKDIKEKKTECVSPSKLLLQKQLGTVPEGEIRLSWLAGVAFRYHSCSISVRRQTILLN